ncbi:MAG: thioredoxin [Bacteroidetes bacterium]|jgi:thiol-disulfide isomerase/thioredoxin|nr:thioredoxin [Bacteroidota bacterium]
MKTLMLLFALLGTARYCSKPKHYNMSSQNANREKLIAAIQPDLQSSDSLQKANAEKFAESITTEFSNYKPDKAVMAELKSRWNDSISVQVIGGNWCSDTRRELPRICKVLDIVGAKAEMFGYYKVNKEKKPVDKDFASLQTVTRVPTVFVFKNGKLLGQIVETPVKSWEKDLGEILK